MFSALLSSDDSDREFYDKVCSSLIQFEASDQGSGASGPRDLEGLGAKVFVPRQ